MHMAIVERPPHDFAEAACWKKFSFSSSACSIFWNERTSPAARRSLQGLGSYPASPTAAQILWFAQFAAQTPSLSLARAHWAISFRETNRLTMLALGFGRLAR